MGRSGLSVYGPQAAQAAPAPEFVAAAKLNVRVWPPVSEPAAECEAPKNVFPLPGFC